MTCIPQKTSKSPPPQRASFTLVELVLALALAALILTAAARITVQVARTENTVEARIIEHLQRRFPLDALASDLRSRLDDGSVAVRFDAHHRPMIEIVCLAADAVDGATLKRVPCRVRYRVLRDEGGPDLWLVRESASLVDQAESTTTTLACGLADVQVEVFADKQWRDLTDDKRAKRPDPEAIQLQLQWRDVNTTEARVFDLREHAGSGQG